MIQVLLQVFFPKLLECSEVRAWEVMGPSSTALRLCGRPLPKVDQEKK